MRVHGLDGSFSCPAGSYCEGGATQGEECPAGTTSGPGASSCTNCTAGRSSGSGETVCSDCEIGRYAAHEGADTCVYCDGATSSFKGSTSCIICDEGYYRDARGVCKRCPEGAECAWNTNVSRIVLDSGFWRTTLKSADVRPCFYPMFCLGNDECLKGHEGPYCRVSTACTLSIGVFFLLNPCDPIPVICVLWVRFARTTTFSP